VVLQDLRGLGCGYFEIAEEQQHESEMIAAGSLIGCFKK
jgi:hypothetical protein